MPAQLTEAFARAALNETERRAVARIVGLLEAELGDGRGRGRLAAVLLDALPPARVAD